MFPPFSPPSPSPLPSLQEGFSGSQRWRSQQLFGPSLCTSVLTIVRGSGSSLVALVMELQLFSKCEWNIGRPIIADEIPWFKGKDVATSLEYANPKKAVLHHVDDEDKKTLNELFQGGTEAVTLLNQQRREVYINESGLYSRVFGTKCP